MNLSHVRRIPCLLILLTLTLPPVLLHAQDGQKPGEDRPALKDWTYQLHIRHKQTRSEGRTGTLTRDGKEITGTTPGEIIDTPCGKFKWFGKPEKDDPAFKDRGWLCQSSGGRQTLQPPAE